MLSRERSTIYTVGHSNRSLESFIRLLKSHTIESLVDVRRFPTSRKFPHFSREVLHAVLATVDIEYTWLGDLLGGFRSGGYEAYTQTDDFRTGLSALVSLARRKTVAIMCAESLWFRCHRRFIADELVKKKIDVVHIIDERNVSSHKLGENHDAARES